MAIRKCWGVLINDPNKVSARDGYYQIATLPGSKSDVTHLTYYWNKEEALEVAKEAAIRNPKVPVLLMESVQVFETKRPDILAKNFNEMGELLPEKRA